MKKKMDEFEQMSLMERREFLKYMSGVFSLPLFSDSLKFAAYETLMGKAYAQNAVAGPILFLEVNYRDQWDFGSVFVAPGVATNYSNLTGKIALFNQPTKEAYNFYLTPQAVDLRPHLSNIAVMELGESTLPGTQSTHGHEAGNPIRSPGRVKGAAAGKKPMDSVDKRPKDQGNEALYSATPTPLILHNYYQKSQNPALRNGVLLRVSVRPNVHTFYHFEGNLQNAQVDRYFDSGTLLKAFPNSGSTSGGTTQPQTTVQKHGALISKLLKYVDQNYMDRLHEASGNHMAKLNALEAGFSPQSGSTAGPLSLALTAEEAAYWKQNIPEAMKCPGDDAANCYNLSNLMNVGEMFAYAFKLFRSQTVRSIGIDFNMQDVHTNRTSSLINTQALQTALPLARFIASMKTAGLWDRTLIAMYTLDASRSPKLSSTGDGTKNAVVLAGGMIKGGYYGDVRMSTSGQVTYHRPDDAGNPIADGVTGRDARVPAADIYKTVATASGLPASLTDSLPDVKGGKVLSYMLKS